MRNKKLIPIVLLAVAAAAAVFVFWQMKNHKDPGITVREIKPFRGSIENTVSTTGTVLPKNRLEIKPPVNGRIDEVLVREGQKVKTGETIAWMSSTERAALLDAARGKNDEALAYWKDVYKAIPLISPIEGEVIVAKTQPGQTVTTAEAVIVLSDRLIVRAQVDETDIGKVKEGQNASISLDAYPDTKIKAEAGHIYHESKTVNNVTIYEVDLFPQTIPEFFRSGMNTTIEFITQRKEDVLLIPSEAVFKEKEGDFVYVDRGSGREPEQRAVTLGIADDKNSEVVSGLQDSDTLIMRSKKFSLPKSQGGTNPFLPQRARQSR